MRGCMKIIVFVIKLLNKIVSMCFNQKDGKKILKIKILLLF